jgi:hypothetical protein
MVSNGTGGQYPLDQARRIHMFEGLSNAPGDGRLDRRAFLRRMAAAGVAVGAAAVVGDALVTTTGYADANTGSTGSAGAPGANGPSGPNAPGSPGKPGGTPGPRRPRRPRRRKHGGSGAPGGGPSGGSGGGGAPGGK